MFYFSDFLSNLLFFHFENRDRTEGKGQIELWVKSRKTKSRSTGIVKSWYFCLCLLCSIFDWTVSGKSVGRRQLPVKVRVKPALLSHWKQPFPFSLFSSFLDFQTCFFLPCSLLFFRLWCSHTVWDCHSQRTRTKTVYRLFVLVFRLNFPCKYVVSGCFPFQLFFLIYSFFFWKQRENKGQTADRTGSEKPENKKQKYPDC